MFRRTAGQNNFQLLECSCRLLRVEWRAKGKQRAAQRQEVPQELGLLPRRTYLAAEDKLEELSKVRVTSSPAQMISGVQSKNTNRSHEGIPLSFLYNTS